MAFVRTRIGCLLRLNTGTGAFCTPVTQRKIMTMKTTRYLICLFTENSFAHTLILAQRTSSCGGSKVLVCLLLKCTKLVWLRSSAMLVRYFCLHDLLCWMSNPAIRSWVL